MLTPLRLMPIRVDRSKYLPPLLLELIGAAEPASEPDFDLLGAGHFERSRRDQPPKSDVRVEAVGHGVEVPSAERVDEQPAHGPSRRGGVQGGCPCERWFHAPVVRHRRGERHRPFTRFFCQLPPVGLTRPWRMANIYEFLEHRLYSGD